MNMLGWIIVFSLLGSVGVVFGAGGLLLLRETAWRRLISLLVSFAVGTLLGGTFLGLLPGALEQSEVLPVFSTVLAGVILFLSWKNGCCGGTATTPNARWTGWQAN